MSRSIPVAAAALAAVLLVTGCGESGEPEEVTPQRVVMPPSNQPVGKPNVKPKDRPPREDTEPRLSTGVRTLPKPEIGKDVPDSFADVPSLPGTEVVIAVRETGDMDLVRYNAADADVDEVLANLTTGFEQQGWEIQATEEAEGQVMLFVQKGDRFGSAVITGEPASGTLLEISVLRIPEE